MSRNRIDNQTQKQVFDMHIHELEKYLYAGESISVEFKRCGSKPEADTFETICAFSNRFGGNIFLGIGDDGAILGVPKASVLDIERNIINVLNNPKAFFPYPPLEFETIEVDEKTVIRVWVPMSPSVHRYKGEVYDRVSDGNIRINNDSQLTQLCIRKQSIYSEQRVFRYLEKEDLRLDMLDRIRRLAQTQRSNHPWVDMDDDQLLQSARLREKDFDTGYMGFNLAAALLLGKDETIASICSAYKTDAILRKVDLDRYDDRIVVRTNLIESYDALMGFCAKNLPDPFYLEGSQSISLRGIISRELVSNLLIHREFTNPFPAKLIIDNEGIHTENASRAIFQGQLSLANFNPMPKNPIIANFFVQIGFAEELGSGLRNLNKYSRAYFGADPVLIEGDIFRTFIPDVRGKMGDQQTSNGDTEKRSITSVIDELIESKGYATVSEAAENAQVSKKTASRRLSQMTDQGILVAKGTTRDRKYFKR